MTNHSTATRLGLTARRIECGAVLSSLAERGAPDAKRITQLRRDLGSELADLLITSASLQSKACEKFGDGVWWVTAKSLQQATPWQVARLKSTWFRDLAVYDFCCGVAGDAMAFARRGPVVAVDLDAVLVEMATENLARVATPAIATAVCRNAIEIEIPPGVGMHIDPDRRAEGRRTSQPEQYQPCWSDVKNLLAKSDCAVVKLAPAAVVETSDIGQTHSCWISLAGSVREQSLLCGAAIENAGLTLADKSAISVRRDGSMSRFTPLAAQTICRDRSSVADRPMSILIDPDPAIRAAGLTEIFATTEGLQSVGGPAGFLTCDESRPLSQAVTSMAVTGRVIWLGSCDDRKLRREFRSRDVYPATIKCRGTAHDPARLAKRYRPCGETPVTLWIGRAGGRMYAAMTETP